VTPVDNYLHQPRKQFVLNTDNFNNYDNATATFMHVFDRNWLSKWTVVTQYCYSCIFFMKLWREGIIIARFQTSAYGL